MTDLDQTLSALADARRRKVVELLGQGPRRAGELAAEVGLSAPAMSRHLRVLRQSGLVDESRGRSDSRVRVYALRREPFVELSGWLEHVAEYWTEQLDAFRAHVERVVEGEDSG